jgi:hypothetical protein
VEDGMIVQFHTPKGIVNVDPLTVTDTQLAVLNIDRKALAKLIPRDLAAELDDLKARVEKLEKMQS